MCVAVAFDVVGLVEQCYLTFIGYEEEIRNEELRNEARGKRFFQLYMFVCSTLTLWMKCE